MKNENLGKLLFDDESENQFEKYIKSEISDISLKNKINNVKSSLKLSNISKCDDLDYEVFASTKNNFVDNMLDIIILLLKKSREVAEIKDSLNNTIEKEKIKYEELDKKFKKINSELTELKKELQKYTNKNINEKEKTESDKKSISNELNELKLSNKKLNNMLLNFKNEMKKKENEYNKIQEKIKKVIGDKKNYPDIELTSYITQVDPFELLYTTNPKKYEKLIDQNEILFSIMRHTNQIITSIIKKINDKSYDIDFMELIGINENLFSIHLIDEDLQTFYDNFKYNSKIFENILNNLIDGKLLKKETVKDSDILKNFKRWSLSGINIEEKPKRKWYENMEKHKRVVFKDGEI